MLCPQLPQHQLNTFQSFVSLVFITVSRATHKKKLITTPSCSFPPEQSKYRIKWLKAIQHDQISKWKTMCSVHFRATDFCETNRKILRLDAVPTQQMPPPLSQELLIEHNFRNCCRFCLEPNGDDESNQIFVDWNEWPRSEYSNIFEDITNLKVCILDTFSLLYPSYIFYFIVSCIDKLFEILLFSMY